MLTSWFLLIVLTPAQAVQADDNKLLQGKWRITSAQTGNVDSDTSFLMRTLIVAGSRLKVLKDDGQSEGEFEIVLRSKKTPKEIDLKSKRPGRNLTLEGIYLLDGDTLTLAWSNRREGAMRPQNFNDAGGPNEWRVYELTRIKK